MVGHQDIRPQAEPVTLRILGQKLEISVAILCIDKDFATSVPSLGDVMR